MATLLSLPLRETPSHLSPLTPHMDKGAYSPAHLLGIPPELIDQIFSFLSPYDLTRASETCHRLLDHARKDNLWQHFIQRNVSVRLISPGSCPSFRQLFINHHARWFLTKHKIWYSDCGHAGRLMFARFDPETGCIEAYGVGAERRQEKHARGLLNWDGQVEYDTFDPKVRLDLTHPLIHLPLVLDDDNNSRRFVSEISMPHTKITRRLTSTFNHTRSLPPGDACSNASVWPPRTLPSPGDQRTRNESKDHFKSLGHVPSKLTEASDATFRIRQWIEFNHFLPFHVGGRRVAEEVSTYATLDEQCYTPTNEKPWQGIWCGDYSGHGCEFLVIMQPDNPKPLPDKARRAFNLWPHTDVDFLGPLVGNEDDAEEDDAHNDGGGDDDGDDDDGSIDDYWTPEVVPTSASAARNFSRTKRNSLDPSSEDQAPYRGRLEAVKLTGDPNVPRGEITFIANDLGANGLVGFAQEPIFNPETPDLMDNERGAEEGEDNEATIASPSSLPPSSFSSSSTAPPPPSRLLPDVRGARIVRAVGHIAGGGFTHDAYVPTQLILVSENRLAMYWRHFGHVSFYERVDIERFLVP